MLAGAYFVTHDTNTVTENVTLIQDRVTIQEAARISNISRQTLYRWIEKGLLFREKDKNLSFVSLAEVHALCNQSDKPDVTDNVTSDNQDVQQDVNRVTVDRAHYDGLLVRLGQYEAERRYLLEYKTGLEVKDKELTETKATLQAKERELAEIRIEVERLRLPFWRRWFKR
jgi:DNA-binding transcriptional MerR regulator